MQARLLRIAVTALAYAALGAVAVSFAGAATRGYFYPETLPDKWNKTGEAKRGKTGGWL